MGAEGDQGEIVQLRRVGRDADGRGFEASIDVNGADIALGEGGGGSEAAEEEDEAEAFFNVEDKKWNRIREESSFLFTARRRLTTLNRSIFKIFP
jgi:hypothetical protein